MGTISVVIPTYNRGPHIRETVRGVLCSEIGELQHVEVLVVDDGSVTPAEQWLQSLQPTPPFSLKYLRQPNAGPARARNLGFAASSGEIVLFMDDDILPSPGLLRAHVAAHDQFPGSVICGRCPWKPPLRPGALFRLLGQLGHDAGTGSAEDFIPINIVSSGQISVERATFSSDGAVYQDDLVTPAAEEFELSMRLRRKRIPMLFARSITALHDSPVSLAAVCRQQYKHGVGCAEAAQRSEAALELQELAAIIAASWIVPGESAAARLRKVVRLPLTVGPLRGLMLGLARTIEAAAPEWHIFGPLYRFAIGLYFTAGVRDGRLRFAS